VTRHFNVISTIYINGNDQIVTYFQK